MSTTIIKNIGELVLPKKSTRALKGKEMDELLIVKDGMVVIEDGKVIYLSLIHI